MEQERRLAENVPPDSEAASRLIVDRIPGIVLFMTPAGELEFVNHPVRAYFGKSLEQLKHWWEDDTVHPDDRDHAFDVFTRATASGEPYKFEARFRRHDGAYRWFQCRGLPHRDEAGRIVRWYAMGVDIDERKQAEEALRQSEARRATAERDLQLMIDTIPVFVAAYEPDGARSFVNQTWQQYMGLTAAEATGPNARKTFPHFHPEDAGRIDGAWRASLASGQPLLTEARVRGADGQYRWHTSHRVPLRDEQGKIIRWYSVGVDIDDRRVAEEKLHDSELSLRSAIDGIPGLIGVLAPNGRVEAVNRQILEYSGRSLKELNDWATNGTVPDDDRPRVAEVFERSIAAGTPYEIEHRLRRFDGAYLWFNNRGIPVRDDAGQIVCWYVLLTDIDERKRTEEKLRESEYNSRLIADSIPGLIIIFTPDGNFEGVNRQTIEYFGKTLDDVTSKRWSTRDAIHPEDYPRCTELFKQSIASGEPFEFELRFRRSDGVYRWFQSRGLPLRDANGRITRWYNLLIDIDERKRAEEKAIDTERELQSLLDNIPVSVATYGADGNHLYVNKRSIEVTGLSAADLQGDYLKKVNHPEEIESIRREWGACLASGEPFEREVRRRAIDGAYRWHLVRRVPVRDRAGKVIRWYGMGVDIEDRKRAEEALRESEARLSEAERDLQLTIDSIPTMVATYKPDGSRSFVNKQWRDYANLALQEATGPGRQAPRHFHPDDSERAERAWRNALATGEPLTIDIRIRRADGEYRWHTHQSVPLRDEQGTIVKWYATEVDIEDRKQAESARLLSEARLAETERDLRIMLDSIPTITWRAGANGYVEYLNKRWFEYTGTTSEQVRGWRWKLCVHPDDLDPLVEAGNKYVTSGEPVDSEARLRRFDGEYRWFLFRPAPVRDETGNVIAWYGTITDIEDRKQAEQKAREAEREVQHMLDTIPAINVRGTTNGYIQYFSKQWFEYTGTTLETARGFRWWDSLHPEDKDRLVEFGARFVATTEPADCEARLRRSDGTYRWFLFRPAPIRDEAGNFAGWYGTVTDIEDRKQAEAQLAEAERELRRTLDSIPTMTWRSAPNGYVQQVNKRFFEYTGRTQEEVRGSGWQSSVHPDDLPALLDVGRSYGSSGMPIDGEGRLRGVDGEYRWFLFRPAAARDENGEIVAWYGIITDIEDRKRAEEKATEAERELQRTIDSIPVLVGTYSADGTRLSVNKWALEVTGLSSDDISDERWKKAFHPDDLEAINTQWRECLALGEPFEREVRTRMADGTYRAHLTRRIPLRDESGRVIRWYGIAHDIEDQRRAEAELRRSETILAEGQRISSTGSFSWCVDTNELTFSEELLRIFEFDQTVPIMFDRVFSRIHPEDAPALSERMKLIRSGRAPGEQEVRLRMPDGRIKYLRSVGHMMQYPDGRAEYLGAIQDITQRRVAEEAINKVRSELAHVTRVMSLGALTASIAHEVNQPLAGIITNASTCLRMLAADPPNVDGARETARRTIRDGNRAADVITRLRALFGKKAAVTEIVDLNEATREVVALVFSDLLRNRVIVRVELDDEPLTVTGDRVQLQQVILNLVRNASDAMSEVNDRPRSLLVKAKREQDGSARLTVTDAGVGLHPQTAERLFDAFYTSKSDGMGIGLSVSRSIIESHGGKIWAEANDGPGATFSFSIPPQAESAENEGAAGAILTRPMRGAHDRTRNA